MKINQSKALIAISAIALFSILPSSSDAQINLKSDDGKLSLKLIGRTNFDAGMYLDTIDHADNGVCVNDTRLGINAKYGEKWSTKIEICYTEKTISFRDVYFNYEFNKNNHIQFGNFFMPFGIKALGLAYKFVEDASVDYAFCPARKMGIAYMYTSDKFNFTGGIFSDGNVDKKAINQGLNLSAKVIFRPIINESTVLHFGVAPLYTNSPNEPSFTGIMPTTIHTNKLISTGTLGAPSYLRYEGELIFIHKKFYLEGHYQGANVDMRNEDAYNCGGWFAQAGILLIGDQQNYNKSTGLAANASPKNLELLARVDELDFGTKGGRQNDLMIGINYFFSKNLNMKLNFVNAHVKDGESFNLIQLRTQFSF
ncbi:MAG: OprO/OprP family phosphate-selective porin [Bacteroidales bacterium]|nr:OprO/OprP family phosphate-selective porin [Bacteroidales bacterium]